MGSGDGVVQYRDGIAVAQVVLFTFFLLSAAYLDRTRRIGWHCIGAFSLVRLIGAACLLGTISHDSKGLWAVVLLCESLGALLLVFTLLETVHRINSIVPIVHKWAFTVPSILTLIDVIISIGGFTAVVHATHNQLLPTPWSRASIALLAAIFVYTSGMIIVFYHKHRKYAREERLLVDGAAICLPILLVRILYPLIFAITADMMWNAIKGSPTVYVFMTVLPEITILGICTFTISRTSPIQRKSAQKEGEADSQTSSQV